MPLSKEKQLVHEVKQLNQKLEIATSKLTAASTMIQASSTFRQEYDIRRLRRAYKKVLYASDDDFPKAQWMWKELITELYRGMH